MSLHKWILRKSTNSARWQSLPGFFECSGKFYLTWNFQDSLFHPFHQTECFHIVMKQLFSSLCYFRVEFFQKILVPVTPAAQIEVALAHLFFFTLWTLYLYLYFGLPTNWLYLVQSCVCVNGELIPATSSSSDHTVSPALIPEFLYFCNYEIKRGNYSLLRMARCEASRRISGA